MNPTMVNTEALDPELAEIGWRGFNFNWCMGYSHKRFHCILDLLIHEELKDFLPHKIYTILLSNIEENMHNKHIGIFSMTNSKDLDGLAPEQYGIRKSKAVDVQDLKTFLF